MYGEAWTQFAEVKAVEEARLTPAMRETALRLGRTLFDFGIADPPRYQLMNQRVIPGFEPSADSYAPAVRVLEAGFVIAAERGVTDRDDFLILLSIIGGLIHQQLANDPGGERFSRLLPRAVDMWADGLGLPHTTPPEERS